MKVNNFTIDMMKKADIYTTKPYIQDKDFYSAYHKPPLFNKKKYEEEVEKLWYCYVYFLRAELGVASVLVLEDESTCRNIDVISDIASLFLDACENDSKYCEASQEFIKQFKKNTLNPDELVPSEICGDIKAHICTVIFSYDELPERQVPNHKLMPSFILPINVKNNRLLMVNLIKAKFYDL